MANILDEILKLIKEPGSTAHQSDFIENDMLLQPAEDPIRPVDTGALDFVKEVPLRMGRTGGGDKPDYWERAYDAGVDFTPPRVIYGSKRERTDPLLAFLALAGGYMKGRTNAAGQQKLDREAFGKSQLAAAEKRNLENQKVAEARLQLAKTNAARKEAVKQTRLAEMRAAIEKHRIELERLQDAANNATQEQLDYIKNRGREKREKINTLIRDYKALDLESIMDEIDEPVFPDAPTFMPRTSATVDPSAIPEPLDEDALRNAAISYHLTGKMPPWRGKHADAMRSKILNKHSSMFGSTNLPLNAADYGANAGSLKNIQKFADMVEMYENTVLDNTNVLRQKISKIPDLGSELFNMPVRMFLSKATDDPAIKEFQTAIGVVIPEYAKLLQSPTSAVLTAYAQKHVEEFINPNTPVRQLIGTIDVLEQDARNRKEWSDNQIQVARKRIADQAKYSNSDVVTPEDAVDMDPYNLPTIEPDVTQPVKKIRVRLKKTIKENGSVHKAGTTGTIEESEFDPSIHERL